MPVLSDPVITLGNISLESISLSTIELAVTIRVENNNPVGATLESCPFTVSYTNAGRSAVVATGDTGSAKVAARSVAAVPVRVSSHNAALIGALAAFVTGGKLDLTIDGTAKITFLMIPKTVPFSRTVPVTMGQIAGMVTGQKTKE